METTETITIRMSAGLKDRLKRSAKLMRRSMAFVAIKAIDEYLTVQEEQIAGIKKAIAEMNAGKGIPHEKVLEWIDSWGTDNELPTPTA